MSAQQVLNPTPLNPTPATCHKRNSRKRKLRCSFRNAALQKLHCNIGFSAALSCGFQAPTFRHPRFGPADLPSLPRKRPKSPFFCLFRPYPERLKSTRKIHETEEKGLFPQISSDLLEPPSAKPPFVLPALLQKLVGDFFDFGEGNFAGNLAGILRCFFFFSFFFGPTK